MRMRVQLRFVWLCLLLFSLALQATDTPRLTLDKWLEWETVSQPQFSPDGNYIVFQRRWTDKINDRYVNEIWFMRSDGSNKQFLVKGSAPRWSPDGSRIAYLAKGEPQGTQIFVYWIHSGRHQQISRVTQTPRNIAWSPDGTEIAFNMYDNSESPWQVNLPRPKGARWVDPPRVITRLNYRRDRMGYLPNGYSQIYRISTDGGSPVRVTSGPFNHGAPRWSPDGEYILFSGLRIPDWEWEYRESELYRIHLKTGQIEQLTHRKGADYNPQVSPDGKFIAYLGYDKTDDTYYVPDIYLIPFDGGVAKNLTAELDRRILWMQWDAKGNGLFFVAQDRGTQNVYYVNRDGKILNVTSDQQVLTDVHIGPKDRIVAIQSSYWQPGDVVVFEKKRINYQRLTGVNDDVLEGVKLGEVEQFWYDSVGGMKIQGWIVKPPDFDPGKKYPLILYIHGGPHAMYSVGFKFEFQNHAANGFVVLYTNPRGSSGYGKAFGNAIKNNYPGQDYDDLMNGVDEVIARGYIDETNLFVCGGSGGGVLTSWIIGHTDRFAAAGVMKPVTNWFSFVGTTDYHIWYYSFKKHPWADPSEHLRRSPLMYVGHVTTPTLLITGEEDLRTPMEQTEQYYRALKLRKVDTAMIRIADEYHPIGQRHPSNKMYQILYLREWFKKYLK